MKDVTPFLAFICVFLFAIYCGQIAQTCSITEHLRRIEYTK